MKDKYFTGFVKLILYILEDIEDLNNKNEVQKADEKLAELEDILSNMVE